MRGSRWPKDRYGNEIDVDDYLMFINWCSTYPTVAMGKVVRVGKTGKVHVTLVKLHPKDVVSEMEVNRCGQSTKLSQNMINAMMLEKLTNL